MRSARRPPAFTAGSTTTGGTGGSAASSSSAGPIEGVLAYMKEAASNVEEGFLATAAAEFDVVCARMDMAITVLEVERDAASEREALGTTFTSGELEIPYALR